MQILARAVVLLMVVMSAACATVDRFTFHTVPSTSADQMPPGIRVESYLDGVHEHPTDGLPHRMYEMRVDISQGADAPEWRPSFVDATLHDDEGNVFPLSASYIDSNESAPKDIKRYRAVFELRQPYRFQSIMAATVRWKLVSSRNSPEFRVTSRFQN